MVLVIDTFKLIKGVGKSIGIYNLTKSIVTKLGAENVRRGLPEKIIILGNEFNRSDMDAEGVEFYQVPGDPKSRVKILLWELFGVRKEAARFQADRILFPRGFRPLIYRGQDTIIIHDLIPFYYDKHYPGYFNRLENAYIMNRLKASIRGAQRIITISDASREEIMQLVPGSEGKIREIYNGINDMTAYEKTAADQTASAEKTIAAVTSKLPHKNAKGILKAYGVYAGMCREKGLEPMPIRIIGIGSFEDAGLSREEQDALSGLDISCFSYIEKYEDMCRMIADARCFLFLSYAEGFGFPPLEAMQLGTPVVCSDRTSLPEVVGDAGLLVDPDALQDVGEALIRLQTDDLLCSDLIRKGYRNVTRFGWDTRTQEYWDELFSEHK